MTKDEPLVEMVGGYVIYFKRVGSYEYELYGRVLDKDKSKVCRTLIDRKAIAIVKAVPIKGAMNAA